MSDKIGKYSNAFQCAALILKDEGTQYRLSLSQSLLPLSFRTDPSALSLVSRSSSILQRFHNVFPPTMATQYSQFTGLRATEEESRTSTDLNRSGGSRRRKRSELVVFNILSFPMLSKHKQI